MAYYGWFGVFSIIVEFSLKYYLCIFIKYLSIVDFVDSEAIFFKSTYMCYYIFRNRLVNK